jgi:hypothetical protein
LLLSWLAVSCSADPQTSHTVDTTSHSIDTTSYSRACAGVEDCIAVFEGPIGCCESNCPNTAIRADVLAKYMNAFDAVSVATCNGGAPTCGPREGPPVCPDGRVDCVAGICQFETPPTDAATD